ncbi:NAD(P)-dependent oxidoreductase, partial [Acinetobacter baumannii]
MKHIIIGGHGFVGQQLAANLVKDGHQVVVADIEDKQTAHASQVEFVRIDVTSRSSLDRVTVTPDDVVYNLSAKM